MATPDYVTTDDIEVWIDFHGAKILEAGAFVRPIDYYYLPSHKKEEYKFIDKNKFIFCYSSMGIIKILKTQIRRV